MEEKKIEWKKAVYIGLSKPPVELAKYLSENSEAKYDDVAPIILEKGVLEGLKFVAAMSENKIDDVAIEVVEKLIEAFFK